MLDSDKKQFLNVINGLATIMPGAKITPEALELWWMALGNWSVEEFKAAAAQLLGTCKFMPTPKDFMDIRKASRPVAGEAFAKAMAVARDASWSSMGSATSGDPIIDAAVRACGGYRALALSEESKISFLERSFTEHFEAVSDRETTRAALPEIAGQPQHDLKGLLKGLTEKTRLLD